MKTNEVRQRMKDKGIKPEQMATELGMDVSTFYRKMKNNGFSAMDLIVFKRVLEYSNAEALDFLLA